jgi:hypothetical protein
MYERHESGTGINPINFPELANEVTKLLQMRMDELLGTLGGQLMGVGDQRGAPECSVFSAPPNLPPRPELYSAIRCRNLIR